MAIKGWLQVHGSENRTGYRGVSLTEWSGYRGPTVLFWLAAGACFSSAAAAAPDETAADGGGAGGDDGIAKGLGIEKGSEDPFLIPIEELPPWVAELAQPKMTLGQLQRAEEDRLSIEQVRAPFGSIEPIDINQNVHQNMYEMVVTLGNFDIPRKTASLSTRYAKPPHINNRWSLKLGLR